MWNGSRSPMTDRSKKGAVGIEGEEIIIHGSRYQGKRKGGVCIGIAGRKMADKRARWLVLEYLKGEVAIKPGWRFIPIEQGDEEVFARGRRWETRRSPRTRMEKGDSVTS